MTRYQLFSDDNAPSLAVPARAFEFLSEAGEAELKVLLYACQSPDFSEKDLIDALFSDALPAAEIREALAFWRGAGILTRKGAGKQTKTKAGAPQSGAGAPEKKAVPILSERPNYTSKDLARAVEENPDFKSLIDYAEHRLQKNFNAADLGLLYSFVDRLALPVEVVMIAIEACAGEGKKSLRYIEKLLIDLCDREIDDLEKADEYFKRRQEYLSFEGKIRALCGFGTRALTAQEKAILSTWKDKWQISEEELQTAYEKTIRAIAKPSLSYMNKILITQRDAENALADASGQLSRAQGKTYDLDEFFEAAVERTKRNRRETAKKKKEEGDKS